jgi:small-conductance mechanosensitive channel
MWLLLVELPPPPGVEDNWAGTINLVASILLTLLLSVALLRFLNSYLGGYRRRLREARDPRTSLIGAIVKIINVVLLALVFVIILGLVGYEIGPLLASLGVAGIAVALALQSTLGNLFAGFYLAFDRPIRPGDYVQLESGEEGFVEEIGWRSTRIRPRENNIVIIPNSKLAEATINNWNMPVPDMTVRVECGVDYDSNLRRVKEITEQVGDELQASFPSAVRDWNTEVLFSEFADSNINFTVLLRVAQPEMSWRMHSEFMMALHERFAAEDVEISWPVRKVFFPDADTTPELTSLRSPDG